MKTADVVTGLFFAAVGGGACALAYRLGLGSIGQPGPGFFPLVIAALLGLMSLGLLVKGCLPTKTGPRPPRFFHRADWGRPLLTLAALVGYGIFFRRAGLIVSTFVFLMILVGGVGRQKPALAFIVSAATAGAVYLLFVVLLGVPLPAGTWFSAQGD